MISSLVRPPPYSMGVSSLFLKNFKVGYPPTSNLAAMSGSSVASTLASLMSEAAEHEANWCAPMFYWGSSF